MAGKSNINGKSIMEHDECLNCALANAKKGKTPPCGYDYTLLNYIYGRKRYQAQDIHVSDILQCPRKSFYEKKTTDPVISAHNSLVMSLGALQHKLLEDTENENFKSELLIKGKDIVGTADVVYENGRIVDYKTTRNINVKYLPKKEHKLQVNIYAHLLRQSGKEVTSAAIQYIDFMGPSMCPTCKAYVVPNEEGKLHCPICGITDSKFHLGAYSVDIKLMPDDEVKKIVDEKVAHLKAYLERDEVPEADPSFLCRYCPFLGKCPAGQAEVYGL